MTLLAASHMCSADAILGSSFTVGYFQHASFFSHWTARTAEARSFFGSPRGGDRAGIFIFLSLRDLTRIMFLVCMWRSAARASSAYEWRDLLSVRRDLLSLSLSSAANSREEN